MSKKNNPNKVSNINKGIAWLYSEVCALLDVWADHDIQQQLAGRLHNMCVFEKISRRLLALGIDRTAEQCREKIKKLKRDYKTVIDNNYSPAFARKLLGCFDKVHEVFGNCAIVKPVSVIESFAINEHTSSSSDVERSNGNSKEGNDNSITYTSSDSEDFLPETDTSPSSAQWLENVDAHVEMFNVLREPQDEFCAKVLKMEREQFQRDLEKEKRRLEIVRKQRQRQQQHELQLYKSLLTMVTSQGSDSHLLFNGN